MALSEAAKKIGDMPAYPLIVSDTDAEACEVYRGLTKREWLIGQALAGMLGNPSMDYESEGLAQDAFARVDGVLERLAAEAAALKPE